MMVNNLRAFYQVMRDAKLDRLALDRIIYNRLKNVLVSAHMHVPYYRELMKSVGYNPITDYSGPKDLKLLPVTTKEDLKKTGAERFIREGAVLSKCYRESTSGSTGIPLVTYRSQYERSVQIAKWLRVLFLNGYTLRQKVMSLSIPWRLDEGRTFLNRLNILRRLPVDINSSPEQMVDAFLAYKPDVLYGVRTQLDMMASELKRRGIEYKDLKLLIVGGEVINENNKRLYQKQFGVKITETYGSTEAGTMLHETPEHNGLHIMEDLTYFEFLNMNGEPVEPGEPGKTVVTDLFGTTMPFIRYDQGDKAVYEYIEDMAGKTCKRVTKIIGRDDGGYISFPDGTTRPFYLFYLIMTRYENIYQYRAVQKKIDFIQLYIATDDGYLKSIRDDMLHRLYEDFGSDIRFEIVRVDNIDPDPSGKLRMFISEI